MARPSYPHGWTRPDCWGHRSEPLEKGDVVVSHRSCAQKRSWIARKGLERSRAREQDD